VDNIDDTHITSPSHVDEPTGLTSNAPSVKARCHVASLRRDLHADRARPARLRCLRHHRGVSDDLMNAMAEFQRCVEARDRAAAEQILDAEFALVLVAPSAARMPRAKWLEVLVDYEVHGYVVEEQMVDEDGPVAAVLSRVAMQATVLGVDRSGVFVISDVWRHRDGGWKLWRRHSTPLSAGRLPET
jgi:hypothetical protein